MTGAPKWSDEDTETAIALWKKGMTAGAISEALEYRYSRNSVLGKMNRMHQLRNPITPPKPRSGPKPRLSLDEAVRDRHMRGQRPSEISSSLRTTTEWVRNKIIEMGYTPHAQVTYSVHPMWSMSEDDRRAAFYAKFMAGWSKVLERLNADA